MTNTIKTQILAIRNSGETNMFDIRRVQQIANRRGYYELVIYLEEHRKEYVNFILTEEPAKRQKRLAFSGRLSDRCRQRKEEPIMRINYNVTGPKRKELVQAVAIFWQYTLFIWERPPLLIRSAAVRWIFMAFSLPPTRVTKLPPYC